MANTKRTPQPTIPTVPAAPPFRVLSREDILGLPDADDGSPNWQDWSCEKADRERHHIPELDAVLRGFEDTFRQWVAGHLALRRTVIPDYNPESVIDKTAFYARLAHAFNITPKTVADSNIHSIAGLVKAWSMDRPDSAGNTDGNTARELRDNTEHGEKDGIPGIENIVLDDRPAKLLGWLNKQAIARTRSYIADNMPADRYSVGEWVKQLVGYLLVEDRGKHKGIAINDRGRAWVKRNKAHPET